VTRSGAFARLASALLLAMFALQTAQAQSNEDRSLAERLGYPSDAKLLIVHADDIGVAHSVNAATIELFEKGAITSGSIMVPCPWFPEIAAHAREHADMDLGIHLTLTSEWQHFRWGPVLPADSVPSLVDGNGFLHPTTEAAASRIDPGEAEAEMRAQVDRAIAFGITPTHLDSHMAVLFQTPALFEAYLRVGRDYHLPVLIPGDQMRAQAPRLLELTTADDIVIDRVEIATPAIAAEGWDAFYTGLLENLEPGVTQIIIHAAHDDAEMRAVTIGQVDYGSAWRQRDFDYFAGEEFRKLVERHGVKLITWREIRDRLLK